MANPPVNMSRDASGESVLVKDIALGVIEVPVREAHGSEVLLEPKSSRSLAGVRGPKPVTRPFDRKPVGERQQQVFFCIVGLGVEQVPHTHTFWVDSRRRVRPVGGNLLQEARALYVYGDESC